MEFKVEFPKGETAFQQGEEEHFHYDTAVKGAIIFTQLIGSPTSGCHVPTTTQTSEWFSKKAIMDTWDTHQLQVMLGHPSRNTFGNILCLNFIEKCALMVHDINNTSQIFGHDFIPNRAKP